MQSEVAIEETPHIDVAPPFAGWAYSATLAAKGRMRHLSLTQKILWSALSALALTVGVAFTVGPVIAGYLSVFALSVLTNAVLFVPSGRGAVLVAGALTLNPLAVAVLTGLGGALGEMTGYALGRSSRAVVKGRAPPPWLQRAAKRNMTVSIIAISIVPSPFVDVIGVVAGRMGYPVGRFLAYSAVGKVIQSIAFVYLALWNLSLVGPWLGLG